jgi:hypothetical protein
LIFVLLLLRCEVQHAFSCAWLSTSMHLRAQFGQNCQPTVPTRGPMLCMCQSPAMKTFMMKYRHNMWTQLFKYSEFTLDQSKIGLPCSGQPPNICAQNWLSFSHLARLTHFLWPWFLLNYFTFKFYPFQGQFHRAAFRFFLWLLRPGRQTQPQPLFIQSAFPLS